MTEQDQFAHEQVMLGASPNVDISLDAGADADDKSKVRASEAKPPEEQGHRTANSRGSPFPELLPADRGPF